MTDETITENEIWQILLYGNGTDNHVYGIRKCGTFYRSIPIGYLPIHGINTEIADDNRRKTP